MRIKNGLVVGIFLLFVGVAVQPSIATDSKTSCDSSNIISENDNPNNSQVTTTIKIHKPNDIETYTLKMTREQRNEFDTFVDAFKKELEKAETLEETIKIYNNAIITLYKIGLIPDGISVEELQQLITGSIQLKLLKYKKQKNQIPTDSDTFQNIFCLISGKSTETYPWFVSLSGILGFLIDFLMLMLFGVKFGLGKMVYGTHTYTKTSYSTPAIGWMQTLGLLGRWKYEGQFFGQLQEQYVEPMRAHYIGTIGFRGIFFSDHFSLYDGFCIGRTMMVKIGSKRPEF